MENNKTHWLQSPNKNYLGHWDLPNGNDLVLTIKSAGWEEVKNPIINVSEARRVIRFEEDVKPFICNETNAQSILHSTKTSFMEDSIGKKIVLYLSSTKLKGESVNCLRVKKISQEMIKSEPINNKQRNELLQLIEKAGKDVKEFCEIMKIKSVNELPNNKFKKTCDRLKEIIEQSNENN